MREEKKFEALYDLDDSEWEVLTDSGYKEIKKIGKTIPYDVYEIETDDCSLKCADNHLLFDSEMREIYAKDLEVGKEIQTSKGIQKIQKIQKLGIQENMYDLQVDGSRYFTNDILSHNTTIITCFILHYVLFNKDKNVCILANKGSMAKEIMARIQLAYTNLPKWIQQGVVSYNKFSMELENGSKIVCAATASDSIRGQTFSCVTGDTIITVRKKGSQNPTRKKIQDVRIEDYNEVLTEEGFKEFKGVLKSQRREKVFVVFRNGKKLKCTPDHRILIDGFFQEVQNLKGNKAIIRMKFYEDSEDVYDLLDVKDTNHYITNGITSHNCVLIDECIGGESMITIRDKETGEIKKISMEDFYDMIP